MSGTFIKIDSLQHLEISRQTYPTNWSKICVTTFTVLTLRKTAMLESKSRTETRQAKGIHKLKW